jgi:ABC-type transport system substrate-binding protein
VKNTWGKYDVADAKKKLSAAGFDTSQEYELKYYTPGDQPAAFAQIVQTQLKASLGINIKLVGEDFGKWLAQSLYGGDFNGFISYPTLAYDDPSSYLMPYGTQIGGRPNWSHWSNDQLDAALQKQKTLLDDAEREKAVLQLQRDAWTAGAPYLTAVCPVTSQVTWWYVKNRLLHRGSYDIFWGQSYIDKSNPPS